MRKRVLVSMLTFCMVLTLVPTSAFAVESVPETVVEEETVNETTSALEADLQKVDVSVDGETLAETQESEGNTLQETENEDNNDNPEKIDDEVDNLETESEKNTSDEADELGETLDGIEELLPENAVLGDDEISAMALGASGTCGDNLTWTLVDGTLTISGQGSMEDYDYSLLNLSPWSKDERVTSVKISYGVTSIGREAFLQCNSLTSIEIPSSVTGIGASAFEGCSNLTTIEIPSSTTNIGAYAFCGCSSLTSIEVPSSVTGIEAYVFGNCSNLTSIEIPSSVTSIGYSAFVSCSSLTSIEIPSSVTSIGASAFQGCSSLTSIEIPSSVISITGGTFQGCSSLTSIKIPSSVTSIGYQAFVNCDSLTDVYYGGSESDWTAIEIYYYGNECLRYATIHYNSTGPDDISDAGTKNISGILRSGDDWTIRWECTYFEKDSQPHNGRIEITVNYTNTVEELYLYNEASDSGFPFPWELEPYHIPKSAIDTLVIRGQPTKTLRIAADSFRGYDGLKNIVLEYVSGVDSNAFKGCTSLKSVGFLNEGKGLTTIGSGAFEGCTSLTKMDFPSGLTHIGAGAFRNTALGTITLGSDIVEIGDDAFSGCQDLLIRCFKDSVAHRYAQKNNIPFQLITEDENSISIHYGNGKVELFAHDLDYYVSTTSSTAYSPQLSHMLIAMSCAAYNENNVRASMKELGFSNDNIHCCYSTNDWSDLISYAFGKKTMSDGKTLVLVAIRGSSTSLDWLSDFDLGTSVAGCFWHAGFESAANTVYDDLVSFMGGDLSDAVFVVTGHSRGAAAANLLEVKLFDAKVASKNVYGYNFACPDVAAGLPTGWNWLGEHNNIFNIGNAPDPVSMMPGVFGSVFLSAIPGTSWGKFGQSRWFSKDWNNLSETTMDSSFSAHGQEVYLKYLHNEPSFASFKTWGGRKATVISSDVETFGRLLGFCCPVDVTIADKNGNPIAAVADGTLNYYDSIFGEIFIFTDGDKKAIMVQGDEPLSVHFTATGDGTMEYTAQRVNVDTQEIIAEKVFTNVELAPGKQFVSGAREKDNIAVGVDMKEVNLYILSDSGVPEKEVLADGNGTEVPINNEDKPNGNKPGSSSSDSSSEDTSSNSDRDKNSSAASSIISSGIKAAVETWKPTTPDEKKRYACMGKEAVQYTLPQDNVYRIMIENAMQGPMCFKSFEAVLGDYKIGRTYNVYTLPDTAYSMDKEITFTIKIPSAIYKKDREYKMICVTKGGQPIVYNDLDANPETITVKTNKFYAYALIYKEKQK